MLICFGTRPEWLKIRPILNLLDRTEYKLLFTGQHTDLLRDVEVDYKINISGFSNRLDQIIADCLINFPGTPETSILVQGDTASAFACAVAGFNRGMKIFYLEAGLRSYDFNNPYPEEAYRQMISRIANINFAPTEVAAEALLEERVLGKVYITGNTVLDNLVPYLNECEYTNKVLVTLHRRENHSEMREWFGALNRIARENPNLEFILPIHPNPNVQKHRDFLDRVKVIDPLSHSELISLLTKCKLVITDSGGLQEEASFFNKKVIVCRKTTERPEAISTGHLHICQSPDLLKDKFDSLIEKYYINTECPYGNGFSSEIVVELIRKEGGLNGNL